MNSPLPLAFAKGLTLALLFGTITPEAWAQDTEAGLERGTPHASVLQTQSARPAASATAPDVRSSPDEVTIVYDNGFLSEGDGETSGLGLWQLIDDSTFAYANLYTVPDGLVLSSVAVAPFYDNVFAASEVPQDAPRDFTLRIWEAIYSENRLTGTEMLMPGEMLFSLLVVDDARADTPSVELEFLDIDLTGYESQLADLPDSVFIGLGNAGEDGNYIALSVSDYEGENVSYLYLSGSKVWLPFPLVTNKQVNILENRVIPIRPTFRTPVGQTGTAVEEGASELPDRVELDGNYPNPFNPATTIAYRLPHPAEVRLSVYDALGRRVATLLDGAVQQAGPHEVAVEASAWPSGLYLYRLEAAGQARTGKMTLVE